MSIVYWCLHIWGDSIQAACSGNGQANFDKEFETMIDNGRETLQGEPFGIFAEQGRSTFFQEILAGEIKPWRSGS